MVGRPMIATTTNVGAALLGLALVLALVALYVTPSLVGWARGVRNLGSLIVVNLAFGWTFIGWFVALAMAMRTVDRQ